MKSKFASKTLWFNSIAFVVAVAGAVLAQHGYTGEVPENLRLFIVPAIAIVGPVVNWILRRYFTNTGLQ